mmetsp:Transcript_2417/g.7100  ORF Transcript_2417/g.7100 Transcript_2417/m.7100 type:complete len:176 (-) Transcript_2417:354-881(-)
MKWLDSWQPDKLPKTTPGALRGPCDETWGTPDWLRKTEPDAYTQFSNLRFGPIGSTQGQKMDGAEAVQSDAVAAAPGIYEGEVVGPGTPSLVEKVEEHDHQRHHRTRRRKGVPTGALVMTGITLLAVTGATFAAWRRQRQRMDMRGFNNCALPDARAFRQVVDDLEDERETMDLE